MKVHLALLVLSGMGATAAYAQSIGASSIGGSTVSLCFPKPLDLVGATNAANYQIVNREVQVLEASLSSDRQTVELRLAPMLTGDIFQVLFQNLRYSDGVVPNNGGPVPGKNLKLSTAWVAEGAGNALSLCGLGIEVAGAGTGIAGSEDSFFYLYREWPEPRQLAVLDLLTTREAAAALVLREDLDGSGRNVSATILRDETGTTAFRLSSRATPGGETIILAAEQFSRFTSPARVRMWLDSTTNLTVAWDTPNGSVSVHQHAMPASYSRHLIGAGAFSSPDTPSVPSKQLVNFGIFDETPAARLRIRRFGEFIRVTWFEAGYTLQTRSRISFEHPWENVEGTVTTEIGFQAEILPNSATQFFRLARSE